MVHFSLVNTASLVCILLWYYFFNNPDAYVLWWSNWWDLHGYGQHLIRVFKLNHVLLMALYFSCSHYLPSLISFGDFIVWFGCASLCGPCFLPFWCLHCNLFIGYHQASRTGHFAILSCLASLVFSPAWYFPLTCYVLFVHAMVGSSRAWTSTQISSESAGPFFFVKTYGCVKVLKNHNIFH